MGAAAEAGIIDTRSQPPTVHWRGVTHSTAPDFIDVELHMTVCREAGLTHVMLHQAMITTIMNEVAGTKTIDAARGHNDYMAEIRAKYPEMVLPYGLVRPHDGILAVEEARRCIEELEFKALAVDTSYGTTNREFIHTVEAWDFWEYVDHMRIPVCIHPAMLCYGWEWMTCYKFDETVARPAETALTVSYMIVTGLLDRFPNLQLILAPMGGAFPMCLPRLEFAHRLGWQGFPPFQIAQNKHSPSHYVRRNLWADTMGFDPAGIRHAIELFGIDRVLLGTDYGPVPISPKEHIDIVRNELSLSGEEQEMILGRNAARLFGI